MADELLRLEHISKAFPGVLANDDIGLAVRQGTIRGLVGENGAGKTTLMRIVFGMYQPDRGTMYFMGGILRPDNPRDAMRAGISMVHQHSLLVPTMNVLENILLVKPQGTLLNLPRLEPEVRKVLAQYEMDLDLHTPAKHLSVSQRQRAEIVKSLYCQASLIILDEPTTVLTPQESTELFRSLRSLARQGKTIILITHKLPEVMEATDEVTVLRSGRLVTTKRTSETNELELAGLMVGKEISLRKRYAAGLPPSLSKTKLLEVSHLVVDDSSRHVRVNDVSFHLNEGEILGVAAVQGNGQAELVDAIFGIRRPISGAVLFRGVNISHLSTRTRRDMEIGYVPRERQQWGLNEAGSVTENIIMGHHYKNPFARAGLLQSRPIREYCRERVHTFNIASPSMEAAVQKLSGGNQQKLVLSRELRDDADLIIAEEPTQGLDIAATSFIHTLLFSAKKAGRSVLLISSSLDEIFDLSDRILVMYSGKVMDIVDADRATELSVGQLMMGVKPATSRSNEISSS